MTERCCGINNQLYHDDSQDCDGGISSGRFKAAAAEKNARNVTFKERIGMTLYQAMYGEKKVVSDFRAPCGRACAYLDRQCREKGEHTPRAKEAVHVGLADNLSAWAFWVLEDRKVMTSNQV